MRHQVKIYHADKRREIHHMIVILKRCCKYERERDYKCLKDQN